MRGTTVPPGTPCPTPENAVPIHRLEVPNPNTLPFAVGTFDTIGPLSRATFPHRHTFYEIVHLTAGTGAHVVDLARRDLRPPHLCAITPGQVHHWENPNDLDGTVILFTEDFLLDHPADRDELRRLTPWLTLDEPTHAATTRLITEIHDEYRRADAGFESVLRALLHVLIVRTARLAEPTHPAPRRAVAEEFTRLIGEGLWSVRAAADRIGVTAGYLGEAVKAATGRTAAQWVREARTHEAKRLLVKTDLTVRQVAGLVGFTDPAYFCRFFRRETGASPGEFRRGPWQR